MPKTPVYHLDECRDCAHRYVCKYIDKIDKVLKRGDLPLDLQGASCTEYVPGDIIDEDWKEYIPDKEEEKLSETDKRVAELSKELERQMYFGDSVQEEVEPTPDELLYHLTAGLSEVLASADDVVIEEVIINAKSMELLKISMGTDDNISSMLLTNGQLVLVKVDESVPDWYFYCVFES